MSEIETLAASSEAAALEHQAVLSLAPFAPVTRADLADLASRLEAFDPSTAEPSNSTNILFSAHDHIHPLLRVYLLGRIRARLGESDAALRLADELESMTMPTHFATLAPDLAHGVRAELHRSAGRSEAALAELESMTGDMWYLMVVASPVSSYAAERYARAELLIEAGRDAEAEPWLAEMGVFTAMEKPWLAASRLLRAGIAERRGDAESAARYQAVFDDLWSEAEDTMLARLQ